jgi:hypothetical protein
MLPFRRAQPRLTCVQVTILGGAIANMSLNCREFKFNLQGGVYACMERARRQRLHALIVTSTTVALTLQ